MDKQQLLEDKAELERQVLRLQGAIGYINTKLKELEDNG